MIYSILIQNKSNVPLPGAVVSFIDATGTLLTSYTAGADGTVKVDDTLDDGLFADGVVVRANARGYSEAGITAVSMTPDWYFTLVKKPDYVPYIVGGVLAGGVLVALLSGKGRKVGGFFDNMSPAIKVGILAAGGLAAYLIFRTDPAKSKLPEGAVSDLDGLAKQGIVPTITPTQAEAFASALAQAFAGMGTDEDAVYQVFSQLKTKADVLLLIATYGVRSYQGFFEGLIWEENVTSNLATALSSELSASELAHVNSILTGNQIDFAF